MKYIASILLLTTILFSNDNQITINNKTYSAEFNLDKFSFSKTKVTETKKVEEKVIEKPKVMKRSTAVTKRQLPTLTKSNSVKIFSINQFRNSNMRSPGKFIKNFTLPYVAKLSKSDLIKLANNNGADLILYDVQSKGIIKLIDYKLYKRGR